MNNTHHINNINEHTCLTEQEMFEYIDNKLVDSARFKVEKHILECELCADALDGLSFIKNRDQIADIKENILERTHSQPKVISLWQRSKARLAIAASMILLAGTVAVIKYSMEQESEQVFSQAIKEEKSPEIPETKITAPVESKVEDKVSQFEKLAEKQGYKNKEEIKAFDREKKNELIKSREEIAGNYQEKEAGTEQSQAQDLSVTASEPAISAAAPAETAAGTAESSVEMQSKATADESYATESAKIKKADRASFKAEPAPSLARQVEAYAKMADAPRAANEKNTSGNEDFNYANGISNYKANKFKEAILWFEKYLLTDVTNQQVLLYTGISYLNINNADKALIYLERTLAGAQYNYYEAAKYYKALALIKKNERKEAKALLQDVVKQSGDYKQRAADVLKDLD